MNKSIFLFLIVATVSHASEGLRIESKKVTFAPDARVKKYTDELFSYFIKKAISKQDYEIASELGNKAFGESWENKLDIKSSPCLFDVQSKDKEILMLVLISVASQFPHLKTWMIDACDE